MRLDKVRIIFEGIALFVVVIFGLFGALIIGIVLHEYSHLRDFQGYAQDEKLCGLVLPTSKEDLFKGDLGFYSFALKNEFTDKQSLDKIDLIDKYTELKAYSWSFAVLILFFLCFQFAYIGFRREIKEAYQLYNKDNNVYMEDRAQKDMKSITNSNLSDSLSAHCDPK